MNSLIKTESSKRRTPCANKANVLDGKEWTKYSISVWDDIRKTAEEVKLGHPAMFPLELVRRLIKCFMPPNGTLILDPFSGSGSTLVAARELGYESVGFEINKDFCKLAKNRLNTLEATWRNTTPLLYNFSAMGMGKYVHDDTVDLTITSPPYWDILSRPRSADNKAQRDYGNGSGDISHIKDYEGFLSSLNEILCHVLKATKPGKHLILNVMDIRKKDRFYCFHSDIAAKMSESGWLLDDIIIWNRARDYNNLRPLGYPAVFRINKVHEYLLIMKKPV